jgi:hypothetical protein
VRINKAGTLSERRAAVLPSEAILIQKECQERISEEQTPQNKIIKE